MNAAAEAQLSEIRGVLIPLSEGQVLLPNALVAEVINYQPPQPMADVPDWIKGNLAWRGEILPLVSLEAWMGLPESVPGQRARVVVCNALSGHSRLPYIGVVAQSIPRLVRITRDKLEAQESDDASRQPGVLAELKIAAEDAVIPDLDAVETALLAQLPT